jgi:peptidoglycan/LPS O-acetylase OafA/YrhL
MQRVKELDSIRGLAAMTIVFFHLWFERFSILGSAVDLFFVLSGYLITMIILNNALTDRFLITFYIRRGLRIWPIYYLVLLALVLIYPFLPTRETLGELPYYLTFTQEIPRIRPTSGPTFPSAFRHTWSLAIEEQFYLIWPPLLWLLGKRHLPIVAMSMVGLAVAARALDLSSFILITHCDGLALGGLLAGLLGNQDRTAGPALPIRCRMGALGVGAAVCLGVVTVLRPLPGAEGAVMLPAFMVNSLKPFFLNMMFFALVGTIVLYAGDPRLRWLRDRRLVYLGTISYGIYLYHHFIFEIFKLYERYYGWRSSLSLDFGKLGLSLAVAALSWKYVERPVLSLKSRFGYRSAGSSGLKVREKVDELQGVQAG